MAIGAGFQDIETRRRLTSDFANIMQRGRYYEQRYEREQRQYEQKQAVAEQERSKEQGGARVVSILASDLTIQEMLKELRVAQKEFPNVDLADTGAGRGMFGAYGMFGRRSAGTAAGGGVDLAKIHKDRNAAINAGNTRGEAYFDSVIAKEEKRLEDERNKAIPTHPLSLTVHGPDDSKGISPFLKQEPEGDAVSAAAAESTRQGKAIVGKQLTEKDKQAIKWAKDNPNDPRAKQILAMHGVK